MSIPAQAGEWSFAMQPRKVGKNGTFDQTLLSWFKYRSPRVNTYTVQEQQPFMPEVGGVPVPTGAFKQAQYFVGDVDLIPRLSNAVGLIALGALGAVTTTADETYEGDAAVGVNTHVFKFDTNSFYIPWMAVRCKVPGKTTADDFLEVGHDVKVNSIRITIPGKGKLAMRVNFLGRVATYPTGAPVYANASYEDTTTTPDSGSGAILIDGIEYPFVGATIDIGNSNSTPDMEAIIGDMHPDDIVPLQRGTQIRLIYKWENPKLYRKLLTATDVAGVNWSALPFFSATAGATKAFKATFESPAKVGVTNNPFRFHLVANKVFWGNEPGSMEMTPGNILTFSMIGTVVEPAPGESYFEMAIENDQPAATYVLPSPLIVDELDPVAYSGAAVDLLPAVTYSPWGEDSAELVDGTTADLVLSGTAYDDAGDTLLPVTGGTVTVTGSDIIIGGTIRATFTGNGKTATHLVITFNEDATLAHVQTILRSIKFDRSGGSAGAITATLVITEPGGATTGNKTVEITAS